jgi:hypothetical protein
VHESFSGRIHVRVQDGLLLVVPAGGLHGIDVLDEDVVGVLIEPIVGDLAVSEFSVVNVIAVGAVNAVVAIQGNVQSDIKILVALSAVELVLDEGHVSGILI